VAKHSMQEKRRANRALIATTAAVGLSAALVLTHVADPAEHFDVTLASTVIGVGGRDDPTSQRLQNKLSGNYALGFENGDFSYVPIQYPANLLFQTSIDDGIPKLAAAVANTAGRVRVVSYSEGALVAEPVKRDLAAAAAAPEGDPPPSPADLDFVFIASPYLPNGGIFARFPGFRIPGLLPEFSAAEPTVYDSTYVTNEYDGFADFPAYFNPVSVANALLGMVYAHPDPYYDAIDLDDPDTVTYVTTVQNNGAGGTDTYILVYNPHLPLLAPVRQIASLVALTPLTEPVLGAIEPLLRLVVDAGYTDRQNLDPATPTPFSFITPPAKIVEAVTGVPDAVTAGVGTVTTGGSSSAPSAPAPPARLTGAQVDQGVDAKKGTTNVAKQRTRLVRPTLTSDGNKVTPTPTSAGTTTGSQQLVEPVPTAATNAADDAQATHTTPAASPQTPTPGTGHDKDDADHQATGDAAA
jgi:diacyltrehalose acyltransferase